MRKPIFAANWKMNKHVSETGDFVQALSQQLEDSPKQVGLDYEVFIFPPATHLSTLGQAISHTSFQMGGQNCGFTDFGAYTGEISPSTLKELGCQWALIGHSERRHIFKEDDVLITTRVQAAMEFGLNVLLCVGELLPERKAGKTIKVVETQLSILKRAELPDGWLDRLVVAYEPVWAIGTGETATPDQAQEVHAAIRSCFKKHGHDGDKLRILYGGSAKPDNSAELMAQPDVDGLLVGGASLDPTQFANLIKNGLESASV